MKYYLHNTSREIANRTQRYAAASHKGLKQVIGGMRILRGRPLPVSEDFLSKNEKAILAGIADGSLELRTQDGRKINPRTGETRPVAPPAAVEIPIQVMDSVADDPPSGIPMPIYPGGAVQSPMAEEPAPAAADEDEDVEVEHTESGSGAKGGKKHRRR